jgi:VanZ like family
VTRRLFEVAVRLARWAAILSLTITVIGVLLPASDLPENLPPDYYLHGIGFGVPALLAAFAAQNRRNVTAVAITIMLIALASELAQYFVPGRDVSAHDMAANAIGVAIGSTVGLAIFSVLQGLLRPSRSR